MKRVLKLIGAILCGLIAFTGMMVELSGESTSDPGVGWFLVLLFIFATVLLFRSFLKSPKRVTPQRVEVSTPIRVPPTVQKTSTSNSQSKARYDEVKGAEQLNAPCYVVFDVETTGLNERTDKIIEVAALKVEHGQIVDRFETLVHPGCEIPAQVTKITGIKTKDVRRAPFMSVVAPQLVHFIGDAPIVGHNAVFDAKFLVAALRNEGIYARIRYIDTLALAKQAFPGLPNYKLSTLIVELGISQAPQAHRAMSDVEQTLQLYQICRDNLSSVVPYQPEPKDEDEDEDEAKFNRGFALSQLGMDYEKNGDLENAINYYESAVAEHFKGTHPYQRLAVLYRKQKRFEDEIRICDLAIAMLQGSRYNEKKIADFEHRKVAASQKLERQVSS